MNVADISSGRTRLRLTGADRVEFLHGQCTNDVRRLRVGESCYAAFLNAKGKMRGDADILCREECFVLEASVGLRESLEKFIITEDVTIEDISETVGAWIVVGALPVLTGTAMTFSHPLGTGVLSSVPLPVTLCAPTLDALRIEAGIPKWGVDMDETTIPVEAGLARRAISYDKGCYIGQETIARIKTYGHVNRHLVQLAATDSAVATGEVQITSAARSIPLGKTLALGYVRRELAGAGTILRAGEQLWEVVKLCGE